MKTCYFEFAGLLVGAHDGYMHMHMHSLNVLLFHFSASMWDPAETI